MRTAKLSKIIIFSVCILLVFAVTAALLFSGSASLPAKDKVIADAGEGADEIAGASYPVSADGYTHGSNIGRTTSGTSVATAEQFVTAVNNNEDIVINASEITLSSSQAFSIQKTYSGTIYGNGNKIKYSGPHSNNSCTGNYSSDSSIGGLISVLSGKIYDLNVEFTGGQAAFAITSGGGIINVGGIVGYLNGGTIENCTMTFSGSGIRLGAAAWSSSYGSWASPKDSWPSVGAVAGKMAGGSTIKNVTVKSAATSNYIVAGVAARESSTSSLSIDNTKGTASMLVGYIDGGSSTVDNIVMEGSVTIKSFYGSLLGMSASSGTNISTTNFYNKLAATLVTTNNGNGAAYVKYTGNGSVSVTNMYKSSNAYDSNGTYAGTITDRVTVPNDLPYSIYFDPKADSDSTASSLVVVKTGVTGGEGYSATITNVKSTPYTYTDNYAFNEAGNTVIFRNLSTTASDWRDSKGNFACTINIVQGTTPVEKLDRVNKWESSYTTTTSSTGTAVDNGSKLTTAINNNQNIYLTSDITDFKGFTHKDEYTGILDGNGHTIYIVSGAANSADTVGGLFKRLSGTIKNVRIVLYNSYDRTIGTGKIGTGIVAGNLCGGTVENVYVYIPDGVTFGADGGTTYESYVGAVAGLSDAGCTIKNTTVHLDGKLHLNGTYVYLAGFVGKGSTSASQTEFNMTNNVFKGSGSFASEKSISTEPIYLAATTVLFEAASSSSATINIDGFVNAFKGGTSNLNDYSMYGVLSKNDNGKNMSKWTKNVSNVYDYDSPWADINNKGTDSTGNNYIDVTNSRSTVSTTVEGSSIKVTPYFPADSKYDGKLVLVAGDGSVSVPEVAYNGISGETDGNYKVVTVAKNDISAGSTVTLTEPVIPATPIEPLNEWENGYAVSSDVVPEGYTAVADGTQLANAIAANENIFLTADIMDYVGFNGASETDSGYTGIFDGNGHTVYIVKANTASKQYVGGLFGKLKGTVKNVRIVVMASVDLPSAVYVGAVAGALDDNASVSNVNVSINSGVSLVISSSSSNVGGAGAIAGGLISGSGEKATISNSTVVLNGTLKATAQYTFIAGFVGHLNGGSIEYTNLTFKGTGKLDGVANAGEGVHTAGAGVVGGGVSAVTVNGFINSFNGTLSSGRSAYEVVVRNSQSTSIDVSVSNVYKYGEITTYNGSMDYGTPVECVKSEISTTVANTQIPVTPYFPADSKYDGKLVLVAGDGTSPCPTVVYGSTQGKASGNYMVVTVAKSDISAGSTVELQELSYVNDPSLTTDSSEYSGSPIDVTLGQLAAGSVVLSESDYEVTVTANGGNASVQDGKPLTAGEYNVTVTLKNGYKFSDDSTSKTLTFTVNKKVITIEGVTAATRDYDGTTDVTLSGGNLAGVVSGDEAGVRFNLAGLLSDANAGVDKTVKTSITLSGDKAGNYELTQPEVKVTISPKSVEVSWAGDSFVYSGSAQAPTATATGVGQDGSVNIILTIKNAQSEVQAGGAIDAGSYTAEATTDNGNYTLTNTSKAFVITQKAISVSVTVTGWTYGNPANAPVVEGNEGSGNVTYLYTGQTNGEQPYSSADAPTEAGTYKVTVTIEATQNYEGGNAESAEFVIDKKQLAKPTEDTTTYTYNGSQQTYTPAGFDDQTMDIAGNVQTNANVSGYQVTVSLKDTNNYEWADATADEVEFTFVINKATLTDDTQAVETTYDGQEHGIQIALDGFVNDENMTSAGAVVRYGTQEGTYGEGKITLKNAGSTTVYYEVAFANYATVTGNKTVTVNAKQVAVVWDNKTQTYTGVALKPTATVSAADIVVGDVVNVTVKTTKDGYDADAIDVGTYGAVATADNANYELTGAEISDFTITAADFASEVQIENWVYGNGASTPSVTNNPGSGAVTYRYSGTANDGTEISDSEKAPDKAGSYTVTATIAASGNYAEKVVSVGFTVEKATVDVPEVEDKTYTGETITSGLTDTDKYTVQDTGGIEVKTYTATLTLKDKDNYAWAMGDDDNDGVVTVEYQIVAQGMNINSWKQEPSMEGWTYGSYDGQVNQPVYEATYGHETAKVTYRLKSGEGDFAEVSDLSTLGAGVYQMKVSIEAYTDPEGGESYTALSRTVEFTVAKAAISPTVSIDGWTYGEVAKTPVVGGNTGNGGVTYSYEGTGDTVYQASAKAPTDAGTYKVVATVEETANYLGNTAENTFTIAQKAATATVSVPQNAVYNGAAQVATVDFEGLVNDDVLTATLLYNGEAQAVNAGTYVVTVSAFGGEGVDNYEISPVGDGISLKIAPKELKFSDFDVLPYAPDFDVVYDGKPHGATVSIKEGVLYGDDSLTVTVLYDGKTDEPVNAGLYEMTISVSGNDNYVMGKDNGEEIEILKATVQLPTIASAPYSGSLQTATVAESDLYTVTLNGGGTDVGLYDVTLTLANKGNYKWASGDDGETGVVTLKFGITKAVNEWTSSPAIEGWTYGDEAKEPTATAKFGDVTFSYTTADGTPVEGKPSGAGSYKLVATVAGTDNYDGLSTEVAFEIAKNKVEIPTLATATFGYNGEEQTVSLVETDGVTLGGETSGTDAKQYTAKAILADKANTEWATGGVDDVDLIWNITAKSVTLKAEESVEKIYDGAAYDFSGYIVTGADAFYARDNVTVNVDAGSVYIPGSYALNVIYSENANYSVTVASTDAKLTIGKATLTIEAAETEKEYNGSDITFDFSIRGGIVGNDEVNIGKVSYKKGGAAATPNAIGAYVAEFTLGGAQAEYYETGTVTVNVVAPTTECPENMSSSNIKLPDGNTVTYDGEAHEAVLEYENLEGDTSTYGLVYYLDGNPVDSPIGAGVYTVRVYKNDEIYLIEGVSVTLTINPATLTKDDIKIGDTDFTYSGASNKVSVSATGVKGEPVELKVLYNGSEIAPKDAGSYTVTVVSDNVNYVVAGDVSYGMTVARASVTTPQANALTYDGTEQVAFGEDNRYTLGGTVAATDVSAEGYVAVFTLASDNYKWAEASDETQRVISVEWNIAPATVQITVSEAEKTAVYSGNAFTAEQLGGLFVAPDKVAAVGGKVALAITVKEGEMLNAGEYTVVADVDDGNYTAAECKVTFTVIKAQPNVNVTVQERLMQQGDKLSTVRISLDEGSTAGTVSWEEPDMLLFKGNNEAKWIFVPTDSVNYEGTSGTVTLVVGDEVLTSFEMTSAPDKTEYTAFEQFDATGMVLTATFDNGTTQEVTVDECDVIVENATADGKISGATTNITVTYGNISVEISVSVAKISVAVPTLQVSQFEYDATEKTVDVEEDPLYTVYDGAKATNVGTYNLRLSLVDNVNYAWENGATYASIAWEITPVTVSGTITLPENLVYDGTAKTAAFTLTQGTLFGGAQMIVTYELPDGTKLSGAPVNAGVYEVVVNLPDKTNYRFAEGTEYSVAMTIAKKEVSISTNGDREKYYDGVEVTAAQLAENFSVTDGISVKVTVSGTVLNAGSYTVTATIDESNYTAAPTSYTFTVRKADRTAAATLEVKYLSLKVTAGDSTAVVEYSLDGNVWQVLDGEIEVELEAQYDVWVRYVATENYNETAPIKVSAKITKAILAQYAADRFNGEPTLADVADITALETLAAQAEGNDEAFDETLAALSDKKQALIDGAAAAVEKALRTGGALRGYAGIAVAVAAGVSAIGIAAALGITVRNRKGGKKNEKK